MAPSLLQYTHYALNIAGISSEFLLHRLSLYYAGTRWGVGIPGKILDCKYLPAGMKPRILFAMLGAPALYSKLASYMGN